jgi:hypothetical protein
VKDSVTYRPCIAIDGEYAYDTCDEHVVFHIFLYYRFRVCILVPIRCDGWHTYIMVITSINVNESGSKLIRNNDLRSNRNVHEMSRI